MSSTPSAMSPPSSTTAMPLATKAALIRSPLTRTVLSLFEYDRRRQATSEPMALTATPKRAKAPPWAIHRLPNKGVGSDPASAFVKRRKHKCNQEVAEGTGRGDRHRRPCRWRGSCADRLCDRSQQRARRGADLGVRVGQSRSSRGRQMHGQPSRSDVSTGRPS